MKVKQFIAFLIFSCVLFFSSFTSKQSVLKLIDASSEKWISGINGGGSGTEYYLKIKILTAQTIKFDSIWMNDKVFGSYLANNKKSVSNNPTTFSKNDTVTVRVSDFSKNKTIKAKYPIKYTGAALLRYYVNGKIRYLKIDSIKTIPNINRQ
jgi:hypothetical protein